VDFAALRRAAPPRELLVRAEALLDRLPVPPAPPVFVHGDLWQGNTLWDGDRLTGIIDWDGAGVGPAGIDLGSLRCDAATSAGGSAPDDVLAGYEAATGRPFPDVAYWDLVAALTTPPDMGWFVAAARDQGRADLDQPTMLARRDAFLQAALARLGRITRDG
jgi:aminoglycoside phosphotransferase (APT) family kinase protein